MDDVVRLLEALSSRMGFDGGPHGENTGQRRSHDDRRSYTDESVGGGEAIRSFTASEGHPFGERYARRILPSRFGCGCP